MNEFARGLIQEFDVRTVNEIVPARASLAESAKAIIAREISRDPDL